jgi:hypothetical protein
MANTRVLRRHFTASRCRVAARAERRVVESASCDLGASRKGLCAILLLILPMLPSFPPDNYLAWSSWIAVTLHAKTQRNLLDWIIYVCPVHWFPSSHGRTLRNGMGRQCLHKAIYSLPKHGVPGNGRSSRKSHGCLKRAKGGFCFLRRLLDEMKHGAGSKRGSRFVGEVSQDGE